MNVWVGKPTALSHRDINAVAELIKSGGAVPANLETLKTRLIRSRALAIYRAERRIVAACSLKLPDEEYRKTVFEKAGVPLGRFQNAPELGYVAVDEEMRGKKIACELVLALLRDVTDACYATTDSVPMKRILARTGFFEEGKSWTGKRGALSLWLKA